MHATFTRVVTSTTATMCIGIPAGGTLHQENFNFRSPNVDYDYFACCVNPGGDVYDDIWNIGLSYGRSSPGLIEHSTAGDATNTAWYINSSGDLNNPDPGMMWEINSIANVRYSYGKFINASI